MKHYLFTILALCSLYVSNAQTVPIKLDAAWQNFMADSQLQYGLAGICVLDAQTGQMVFGKNENIGMTPASTQKIFTTVAAFEALGKDYRYETNIGVTGHIVGNKLMGDLVVEGSGDPTFGSWRYQNTKPAYILGLITNALKKLHIDTITGNIMEADKGFDINPVPEGWTWGDMGNYYGAGHWALNWAENQYELSIASGATGTATQIKKTGFADADWDKTIHNQLISGDANTGDGSNIFCAPFSPITLLQGKITANQKDFKVAGAYSFADRNALMVLRNDLQKNGIILKGNILPSSIKLFQPDSVLTIQPFNTLLTIQSCSLDSIVYWFLKKSINLYGEGLVRTIGLQKKGYGGTNIGLQWIDSFYKANSFDPRAIHMVDGSGLSPTNRIAPTALAKALQLAKTKNWFPYFYDALPLYNGMKLKSGTIHRTKSFAGYHTSKNGKQYIVSFMVNNYNGSTNSLVAKMFTVLDVLK